MSQRPVQWFLVAAFTLTCTACSDPDDMDAGSAGADAGRDGGMSTTDAGRRDGGSVDAGGSDAGALDSGSSDAGPTDEALIAECERLANVQRTNCTSVSEQRACAWEQYGVLCRSGNTRLLVDAMTCLDQTACRTFSDPNDAQACLDALADDRTAASRQAQIDFCVACGGQEAACARSTSTSTEIVPYLSDTDIAALRECGLGQCSLDAILTACVDAPGVGMFATCNSL
jgi:hypothetical protein